MHVWFTSFLNIYYDACVKYLKAGIAGTCCPRKCDLVEIFLLMKNATAGCFGCHWRDEGIEGTFQVLPCAANNGKMDTDGKRMTWSSAKHVMRCQISALSAMASCQWCLMCAPSSPSCATAAISSRRDRTTHVDINNKSLQKTIRLSRLPANARLTFCLAREYMRRPHAKLEWVSLCMGALKGEDQIGDIHCIHQLRLLYSGGAQIWSNLD